MQNPLFSMQKEDWMMPTPFILNDAVVIKQRLNRHHQSFWSNKLSDSTTKKKQAELLK
jgi:hypothetical protein